jgi:hypothetical protein
MYSPSRIEEIFNSNYPTLYDWSILILISQKSDMMEQGARR